MSKTTLTARFDVKTIIDDILSTLEKDRERQIIIGRFGLDGRKQTLEEIGQKLGITRERVRQIEKQLVDKIKQLKHPHFAKVKQVFEAHLEELGRISLVGDMAKQLGLSDESGHAQVSFLAHILPDFEVVYTNDHFHHSVALSSYHNSSKLHKLLDELISTVKKLDGPAELEKIQKNMPTKLDKHHLQGLATAAKSVVNLGENWGLVTDPLVNPRSIRDKIYVVLSESGKPMHFGDIAAAIKNSTFKRRSVTTQAIHNELIKDNRFVLVGRGIYALAEWGYTKGTVADVITAILKKKAPLHRDEIVRLVLEERQVKPTTIILNLQGKEQFKRVAKATYALAD